MGDITFNPETGLYERNSGGEGRPRGEHDRGQESSRSAGTRGEEQEKERVTGLRMEEQEKERVTRLMMEEQEKERVQHSPILATANGTKKVAKVKPVVSTAAPAKQLTGSYAAGLTAILAAKAAEAASKQAATPAAKKSTVETEPAPSAKSNVTSKSDTALKTAPVRAKITGPSPVAPKPVPKQLSAPAKAPVVSKDSPTVTKVKRTFTPIGPGGGGEHNLWPGSLFDSHCHLNLVLR